jgi:hypothetical protein
MVPVNELAVLFQVLECSLPIIDWKNRAIGA